VINIAAAVEQVINKWTAVTSSVVTWHRYHECRS